ncbi:hypothetical protein SMICM304S_08661 [Streptomyces microflavus]
MAPAFSLHASVHSVNGPGRPRRNRDPAQTDIGPGLRGGLLGGHGERSAFRGAEPPAPAEEGDHAGMSVPK